MERTGLGVGSLLRASIGCVFLFAIGCGGGGDEGGGDGGGGGGGGAGTYSISGQVSPLDPGGNVGGVTLTLSGAADASTTSDANGNYAFTGLAPGSYTLSVTKPCYRPTSSAVTITGSNVTRNPVLTGRWLSGVWGSSASDVWAVGEAGAILHWNGTKWSCSESGTTAYLNDVWGTASNNVWVVGDAGTILHWDGSGAWSSVSVGTTRDLRGIWGSSASDLWVVGEGAGILRRTLGGWSTYPSSTSCNDLNSVYGLSSSDVVAVGGCKDIREWDGGPSWIVRNIEPGLTDAYNGIWASAGHYFVAVQAWEPRGGVLHHNGIAWTTTMFADSDAIKGVYGTSPTNVWAVGDGLYQYNGTTWTRRSSYGALAAVWGNTTSNFWAVGANGKIVYWNGTQWSRVEGP